VKHASFAYPTSSVLEPTCILPSQLDPHVGSRPGPELQLVAAILEDALNCIVGNAEARERSRRREFLRAYEWISDDTCNWPFAFRNVCDLLGLDPMAVRERLQPFTAAQTPSATGSP
jgi:hypothetical protein